MHPSTILDIINGKATCSDLLSCFFGLGTRDSDVFFALVLLGEGNTAQIAREVGRARANVYRSLEKITELGLCVKIKGPGGTYIYAVPSLDDVHRMVEENVEKFVVNIKRAMEGFEHRLEETAKYRSQQWKEA